MRSVLSTKNLMSQYNVKFYHKIYFALPVTTELLTSFTRRISPVGWVDPHGISFLDAKVA
jgi:hypothetical protein